MNLPKSVDFIDIHTHGGKTASDIFIVENLMAHEERTPSDIPETACSFGIHPWYLTDNNSLQLLNKVNGVISLPNLVAIGEAGFDKLRGPSIELQIRIFEKQITLSEDNGIPVVIHCVRAWDELMAAHKKFKPKMPWLVHGFRGSVELATQLLSKGIYLSFWYDFVTRPESAHLLKSVPKDRIFLETDGADVNIKDIYGKVAADLEMSLDDLKSVVMENFNRFFAVSILKGT